MNAKIARKPIPVKEEPKLKPMGYKKSTSRVVTEPRKPTGYKKSSAPRSS